MSDRITKGSENDYHPVNQYIDEQSKLRKARSFWINAKAWALILIAIGFLMVLLAWAYSLLHKHYILKRVAVVQERVIEEKINDAISSGGISKSVEKLQMLGNAEIAIEKLEQAQNALENEKNKNKELAGRITDAANQINKQKEKLEKSIGEIESFESQQLNSLMKQQELENELTKLKQKGEEREETIRQLEEIKEKNKNATQEYYIFNQEIVKVNNINLRVMTRFKFKDFNASKPMLVDCYIDFYKIAKLDLVDLNIGTFNSDFKVPKKYIDSGFTKQQFIDLKQNNCRFLNN